MQNMKKILGALTALSFVTVAGVSTVACNSCSTKKNEDKKASMDSTVMLDLGLYNKEGKSQVEAKINTGAVASWSSDQLSDIKASSLLNDNKAKSENSFKFLTGVLKLEAKGDGAWDQKTFEKANADGIVLSVNSIDPTLKPITGDFAVSGGTAKVQWKQDTTNLGGVYSVNLKVDESKGVVKAALPNAADLKLTDFDTTKGVLAKFAVDQPKTGVPNGADITGNLKTDSGKGQEVDVVAKLIKQPLKITVTKVNAAGDNFAAGDSLTVKISFGSVQIDTEYQLTL